MKNQPLFENDNHSPQVPDSTDQEYTLLYALMVKNELIFKIEGLKEQDFSTDFTGRMFSAIKNLVSDGKTANPLTLKPFCKSDDEQKILVQIMASCSFMPIAELVTHIRATAKRRQLLRFSQALQYTLADSSISADDLAADAMQKIEDMISGGAASKFQDAYEIGEIILAEMKETRPVASTGLKRLDSAMGGGLYSGFTYGFCARKKVGKTVFASTISHNLNVAGVKHALICGEMGPKQIHQRTLARVLNCNPAAFRMDAAASNANFQKRVADAVISVPRNVLYRNAPGLRFEELKQIMTEAVYVHKVKGIILDYWQLVGGKEGRKSTAEHLDEVAQWIADFGRKHNVWNVVTAQINQDGNTRGGEGLRLACDQCYEMHREDVTMPDMWFEMMDTRYTGWGNVGEKGAEALVMESNGPWLREV